MTLEERVAKIESRNARVQAEKAWEISLFRTVTIASLTYFVTLFFLIQIHNEAPFLNSLITVVGYLLSTQSLPFLKKWWIQKFLRK